MTTSQPATNDLSDIRLGISEHGTGAPLVFTHGWADERTVWDGVVSELGAEVHSISWDLRGHGDSDAPPPGLYSREHALADLERVVTLADAPVVLVGHSLGGYLNLAYALLHPDQVRALVLIAAGPGFRKEEARAQWNEAVQGSARKLGVPEGSEELSKHVDSWVIDSLSDITAPALVIVGERDKRFAASAAVFDKKMDVRASVVVPAAGHGVHGKHPEPVAAAISSFLSGLG